MLFSPLIFLSIIQSYFSYIAIDLSFGHYLKLRPKGLQKGSFFITLDQEEQFCIFPANDGDEKNVLERISLQRAPKTIALGEVYNTIELGKEKADINYYIIIDNSVIKSNYYQLALPYRFKEQKFSLLHKLKDDKKIESIQYSLLYSVKDRLYLGGIPKEDMEFYKHKASCDIDKTKDYWSCQLVEVYIGKTQTKENTYINKYPMRFGFGRKRSRSPKSFLQFLKENYFYSLLKSERCIFLNNISNFTYIECYFYDIVKLENLNFVIQDYVFSLSPFQLFENFIEEYTGNEKGYFVFSDNPNDGEGWILGQEFAEGAFSTFDYEKAQVIFRSKTPFKFRPPSKSNENKIIKISYIIIIGLSTIISVLNILLKYSQNKTR